MFITALQESTRYWATFLFTVVLYVTRFLVTEKRTRRYVRRNHRKSFISRNGVSNNMSRLVTIIFQGLAIAAQIAAPHIMDAGAAGIFRDVLLGLQGAQAILAHNYNPDGTPASVSYEKN